MSSKCHHNIIVSRTLLLVLTQSAFSVISSFEAKYGGIFRLSQKFLYPCTINVTTTSLCHDHRLVLIESACCVISALQRSLWVPTIRLYGLKSKHFYQRLYSQHTSNFRYRTSLNELSQNGDASQKSLQQDVYTRQSFRILLRNITKYTRNIIGATRHLIQTCNQHENIKYNIHQLFKFSYIPDSS